MDVFCWRVKRKEYAGRSREDMDKESRDMFLILLPLPVNKVKKTTISIVRNEFDLY